MNVSEDEVDLVEINLSAFLMLMLISRKVRKKGREVFIKRRSPSALFSFKGQATRHTTVKCSNVLEYSTQQTIGKR